MVLIPASLTDGDIVAIVAPASAIKPELIDGAAEALREEGFMPRIMSHAKGEFGSYSATVKDRLSDLQSAIDDPEVKAIICGRGGYGCVHLLDKLEIKRPIWLAGFSDVSALHALWHSKGYASVHSSMAKELTLKECPGNEANRRLFQILRTGEMPAIEFASHPLNHPGTASGIIRGGNLAVLDGLASTPYDLLLPDSILVIEDVGEAIYRVERMLMRLKLAGILDKLNGLIVGQFTDYSPSKDWQDMYSMIAKLVEDVDIPVTFNAPIGHISANLPYIQGIPITLTVSTNVKIEQIFG